MIVTALPLSLSFPLVLFVVCITLLVYPMCSFRFKIEYQYHGPVTAV